MGGALLNVVGQAIEPQPLTAGDSPLDSSSQPFYVSADSAPRGFAARRPVWVAPLFLLTLVLLSAALVPVLPALRSGYGEAVAALGGVPRSSVLTPGATLSFRPFVALIMLLLGVFSVGPVVARIKLVASAWALYVAGLLALDTALAKASWLPSPLSPAGGLASAVVGLLAFVVTIFTCYRLPAGVRVATRLGRSRRNLCVVPASVGLGVAAASAASHVRGTHVGRFSLPHGSGIEVELSLVVLVASSLLLVVSALDRATRPRRGGRCLAVAFLVPAHNEAHAIADCIRALDSAAGNYVGPCRAYIVDNCSGDGTGDVASQALSECRSLEGVVLACSIPGKSRALNLGLAAITEDVVVRVDADTVVSPSLLQAVVPWFWDRTVGGVSGLPLPKSNAPRWLYFCRLIEVYYGITFLRWAQGAFDGITVMPGVIAAYRRRLLEELGGFAHGMNGEDADITMRIGRLGYRIVLELEATVYTEVPVTLAHLREQRQRWSRGLFHMASRNLSSVGMGQGMRSVGVLPWAILNAGRRSLTIPLLASVMTVEALDPSVFTLREIAVLGGFFVALQLVAIAAVLVAHRRFEALPFVPAFLLFRLLRVYIAFETVLTLLLKQSTNDKVRFASTEVS